VLNDRELSADTASDLASDVSFALMLALEQLSPLERAAFLPHDIFELEFAEVGDLLDRGEAACRQLAARGRAELCRGRPRFRPRPEQCARIATAFAQAARSGDLAALSGLAENLVVYCDGGGKVTSARRPIAGRDRVSRIFAGLINKPGFAPSRCAPS
jgi:RNA polymerase sigma-70 factor, ECF subfamily